MIFVRSDVKKGEVIMRKVTKIAAFSLAVAALATGCATVVPVGGIYTNVKMPVTNSNGSVSYSKTGVATTQSILGLVAWGDGSIRAAAEEGKITKVNSVDYSSENILGVYGKYTTTVYGE
jgi:hypothetical protein